MPPETTTPRCSYDVILPGIDNEAPCALPAGHDEPHTTTEPPAVDFGVCHNGHPFQPGIDQDEPTPNHGWCHSCGEGSVRVSRETLAKVLADLEAFGETRDALLYDLGKSLERAR